MDSAVEDRRELECECKRFLVPDHDSGPYKDLLEHEVLTADNIESGNLRLLIQAQDVQNYSQGLHRRLLTDPAAVITAFESAVQHTVKTLLQSKVPEDTVIYVGIVGELGAHTVTPTNIKSALLGKLVRVEGVITKCSVVQPKFVTSVHFCEKTTKFSVKHYRDAISNHGPPTSAVLPERDQHGNELTLEQGLCTFKNHQAVTIQELPETAPVGQLPVSIQACSCPFQSRMHTFAKYWSLAQPV